MNGAHPPARHPDPAQGGVVPGNSTGPVGETAGAEPVGFDEVTAERLLRADTVDDPALVPVAWLLTAAAAPGTPDEMRRAEAVFTAYAKRPHQRRGLLARLLGFKIAVGLATATAAGGLALAAGTGVLPTPLHPHPGASSGKPSARPMSSTAVSRRPGPLPSASASAYAAANLAGLCAAYRATAPAQRDRQLATPAFAPLVAAAGGHEKVRNYCSARAASAPAATPSHHATGKPSALPSHPTTAGKPR